MVIEGEECERVERFESLCAGTLVWYVGCCACSGRHRVMLTTERTDEYRDFRSREICTDGGWHYLPAMPCDHVKGVLSREAVNNGKVYRVIHSAHNNKTRTLEKELAK